MSMSRRKRARLSRSIQYGVLVLALLLLILFANWSRIGRAFLNVDAAAAQFPGILSTALVNTAIYTGLGFALSLGLGLLFALMKLSSVGPYRWLATAYVEFFRGVPVLLVFIALGYGIPIAFQLGFDTYSTVMISLGLVGGAYLAETIRAGILAVPAGQLEAGRSLGMSPARTTISIVIPQAFRIILPPMTNVVILLAKDSSLVYLLGLLHDEYELTKWGREGLNATSSMTPILLAGLCYLLITVPLAYFSRYLERGTGRKQQRGAEVEV